MHSDPCNKIQSYEIIKKVIRYIDENYREPGLNLTKLSDVFGYVPSYISDMFRMHTNLRVIEYINKKRIESAKNLLSTTDMVLSEIAEKTGFYTEASLIRVFKRYENITPGRYRKLR